MNNMLVDDLLLLFTYCDGPKHVSSFEKEKEKNSKSGRRRRSAGNSRLGAIGEGGNSDGGGDNSPNPNKVSPSKGHNIKNPSQYGLDGALARLDVASKYNMDGTPKGSRRKRSLKKANSIEPDSEAVQKMINGSHRMRRRTYGETEEGHWK
jgi:hypothetical protein